jgi:hypothetical protein
MTPPELRRAAFPFLCAALITACDPPTPPPAAPTSLKASDPACSLPLRRFAASSLPFRRDIIDYPMNRVVIDPAGRLLWNGVPVEPRLLENYVEAQARVAPPILLVVTPFPDAPCAAVRQVLAVALSAGRCRPDRCVFEWPGTDAPPPPAPVARAEGNGSR